MCRWVLSRVFNEFSESVLCWRERLPEGSGQQWRIGSISHGAAFGSGDESQEVVVARTEVASWGVTLGEVGDVWRSTDC